MKIRLQITLEGDDALAYQRALAALPSVGKARGIAVDHKRFTQVLLGRAAAAYAVAAQETQISVWALDCRRETAEEWAVNRARLAVELADLQASPGAEASERHRGAGL